MQKIVRCLDQSRACVIQSIGDMYPDTTKHGRERIINRGLNARAGKEVY